MPVFAQEEENNNILSGDTIPTFEFDQQEPEQPKKKKKVKKKVFYGLKCKRGFTKKGQGEKEVIEIFYFLKAYKEPNPYVKQIFVYDVRKQQIVQLAEINKKDVQFYKILHGPYKKMQGGEVIEQGIFYIGTKHGRWEKYSPKKKDVFKGEEITYNTLLGKEKYYKGWPKEAKITFYDGAHTKIKEVIPVVNGRLHGDYYLFKENGELLVQGKYIDGKKAGIWTEYHKDKNQKMRETQYPASPYAKDQFEPYVLTEWDEKGQLKISKGQPVEPGKKGADPLKEKFKKKK
jgi:antitoxin component YwqK of YwqJK toxin-antitoxin module